MKTVVYQRTNKAPVYFAMKGMLNVERRFILMLKNADEDLVVVGNRAVTTLDHSKTSYKTLLYEAWAVAVNERDIAFRGEAWPWSSRGDSLLCEAFVKRSLLTMDLGKLPEAEKSR